LLLMFSGADLIPKTLRFVQSLPKRQRIPFNQKLRTADPDGSFLSPFPHSFLAEVIVISHRSVG
jgi:hypothetical protein